MADLAPLCRLVYGISPNRLRVWLANHLPPGLSQVLLKMPDGQKLILPRPRESEIFKKLFWQGFEGVNPEFSRVFISLAENATCIIDLGSYLGYYSLLAAKVNPYAKVISVEPHSDSLNYQKEAFEINNTNNIIVYPYAVSESSGSVSFFLPSKSLSNIPNTGSLVNRFGPGTQYNDRASIEQKVRSKTLSELVSDLSIERIDLIKFYIEGLEARVFCSSFDVLNKFQPNLIGWMFHQTKNIDRLSDLLAENNYSVLAFQGSSLVKCSSLLEARSVGDVFMPERGGRSAVLITVEPERFIANDFL